MPTYVSEYSYAGSPQADFIEVAVPEGTDTSSWTLEFYNNTGAWSGTVSFGTLITTQQGQDIYVFDKDTPGLPLINGDTGVAIVDDTGTVLQFITALSPPQTAQAGPAAGETAQFIGTAGSGESLETTDDGASYQVQATPNPGTIPCFAAGTRILTPFGERRIESLAVGDKVTTADGNTHTIRWIQCRAVSYLNQPDAPKPILISAHALGHGRPKRDLVVSVQHRIAMGGFGQGEAVLQELVLAPAISLTALKGVRVMRGKRQVVWYHIALDTHELLLAEGCVAESLFFGPMFLLSLTRRDALKLRQVLPHRLRDDKPALPFRSLGAVKRAINDSPPLLKCSSDRKSISR